MKLKKFTGEGLHGFLDIDIKFKSDLTFLVGINGSGKTTALEAINALFTPSFQTLAKTRYTKIRVEFVSDRMHGFIEAKRDDNFVTIFTSSASDEMKYAIYVSDPDAPTYKEADHEREFYRDLTSRLAQHPVVIFINSLPTPMFLGLNRRGDTSRTPSSYASTWERNNRVRRNIFSGSLTQGVAEAINLAETQYRDTLIAVGRLGEQLRRDMLLELLTVERREGFGSLTPPSQADLQRIPDMRRGIQALANILGLPQEKVREKIGTFLDVLEQSSKRIPKASSFEDAIKGKSEAQSHDIIQALVEWNVNSPDLNRIKILSDMVDEHNKSVKRLTAQNDKYLKILSNFLEDSNKKISFDDRGYISIELVSGKPETHISSLSSGESQIFVILTHLLFNPKASRDNIFIIDEPELSLHVQWQELFVESVISANPNVQYIMATHSPSIILDRDQHCVDVVARGNME